MLNRLPTPVQMPALSLLLDDLGSPAPRLLALALGVRPSTLKRWITMDQAPRPVLLALWWLTRWGLSTADAEAWNLAQLRCAEAAAWRAEAQALRAELARVLAAGDFGCANDPSPMGRPSPQAPRPVLQLVRA